MTVVCLALMSAGIALNWQSLGSLGATAPLVDFNRDIRPILNQNCISCHGGVKKQAGVSFVYREEALGKGKSGRPTVIPGSPNASELIARVTSRDPEVRMPYHAPPLQPKQVALLKEWIREGAPWEEYWSFVAPKPQALPAVKNTTWSKQPLDRFIMARLEKEGLNPSPEAEKAALLRRVSFDLTGLPPTPEELSTFLADNAPNAYEKQVDRLLASPHYGERWAATWLELARYADSTGYESDPNRTMWPYRDWVIDAFNQNLPYDQFVITQLAGDLLPQTSLDERIATSFQRQTPTNTEGGTDDEEFRVLAVMDRVATTWSVLNGVTMNCVQCHSHPYDPIRHTEYYKFLAFYNTSRDADLEDDSPKLPVPRNVSRRSEVARLEGAKFALLREIVTQGRALAERAEWTPLPITTGIADEVPAMEHVLAKLKEVARGKSPHIEDVEDAEVEDVAFAKTQSQKLLKAKIAAWTARLARAKRAHSTAPLEIDNGEAFAVGTIPLSSTYELSTGPLPNTVTALRIEVPVKDPATAIHSPEEGFIVDRFEAWTVAPTGAEKRVKIRYFVPDSEDNLANAIRSKDSPGAFAANSKLFRSRWMIAIPDQRLLLEPGSYLKVQITNAGLGPGQGDVVKHVRFDTSHDDIWTALVNDNAFTEKLAALADVEQQLKQIPSVALPVMAEEPAYERRQTLEFERGNFLTKSGPALSPDVPALFPKLPEHAARDRLTMARWFFAPGQPLTARVAVNRYWEQLFGTGIVETLEDFGSAGQPPSHPELLDWLALHFQNDLRWDMKALLRELVTSATYRQSAKVTPALLERDPHNRLLARGPQQRLTAEMVRDQALLAAGLLSPTLGGPPVMPPQPAGVWMSVYNSSKWIDAKGPDRYRRAIYTYLKRTAIYPSFVTFDVADHVVSLARRTPTNTPLQALVTLNDPVYQEAAQALAQRMLKVEPTKSSGSELLEARLNYGARCVLSRDLSPKELAALESFYQDAHGLTAASNEDMAIFTEVARALLNFDAALTR
jgi:hypothetical protein